jgi:hypothetical protein
MTEPEAKRFRPKEFAFQVKCLVLLMRQFRSDKPDDQNTLAAAKGMALRFMQNQLDKIKED